MGTCSPCRDCIRGVTEPAHNRAVMVDTSVLLAWLDDSDSQHLRANQIRDRIWRVAVTAEPVLTEVHHFIVKRLTPSHWSAVVSKVRDGSLTVVSFVAIADMLRAAELINAYSDRPLDYADASLVVAAERLNAPRVAYFDADFRFVRPAHVEYFDVVQA